MYLMGRGNHEARISTRAKKEGKHWERRERSTLTDDHYNLRFATAISFLL